MTFTKHLRLLARVAGAFYLIITAFALFAYMHVRGELIDIGDTVIRINDAAGNVMETHGRLQRTAVLQVRTIKNRSVG